MKTEELILNQVLLLDADNHVVEEELMCLVNFLMKQWKEKNVGVSLGRKATVF